MAKQGIIEEPSTYTQSLILLDGFRAKSLSLPGLSGPQGESASSSWARRIGGSCFGFAFCWASSDCPYWRVGCSDKLSVGSVTRFCIEALKTILTGSFFRSAVTLDVLISGSCNHFPVSGKFPCPSVHVLRIVFVVKTPKLEQTAVTDVLKLTSLAAVVVHASNCMFHRHPRSQVLPF